MFLMESRVLWTVDGDKNPQAETETEETRVSEGKPERKGEFRWEGRDSGVLVLES